MSRSVENESAGLPLPVGVEAEQLRDISATVPACIYQFERDTAGRDRFTYISPGCKSLYGLTAEEIVGDIERLRSMTVGQDRARLTQAINDSAQALTPVFLEYQIVNAYGDKKWLRATSRPFRRKDGTTLWSGAVVDITDYKLALEQLTHAEPANNVDLGGSEIATSEASVGQQARMLNAVAECLADGVVVADRQGRFLLFNPAAERLVGRGLADTDPAEWSRHYGLFLPDGQTPYPPENLPLARAMRGEEVKEVEVFVRNESIPEGATLSVNATPLREHDGELAGGVVVFRDITARKLAQERLLAEERLMRQTLDLQERERMVVAHEIHDGLAQYVVGAKLKLEAVRARVAAADDLAVPLEEAVGLLVTRVGRSSPIDQ